MQVNVLQELQNSIQDSNFRPEKLKMLKNQSNFLEINVEANPRGCPCSVALNLTDVRFSESKCIQFDGNPRQFQ